jgi:hypothetical protein
MRLRACSAELPLVVSIVRNTCMATGQGGVYNTRDTVGRRHSHGGCKGKRGTNSNLYRKGDIGAFDISQIKYISRFVTSTRITFFRPVRCPLTRRKSRTTSGSRVVVQLTQRFWPCRPCMKPPCKISFEQVTKRCTISCTNAMWSRANCKCHISSILDFMVI